MLQILSKSDFKGLDIPLNRVWGQLGYEDTSKVRPAIRKAFQQAVETGQALIEPKGCYDIFELLKVTPSSVEVGYGGISFDSHDLARRHAGAKELAAYIVTIGPDLETRVAELFRNGNMVLGSILDAYGSIAVETLAQQIREQTHRYALSKGYAAMTYGYCIGETCQKYKRCGGELIYWWSPGYGDWDTREQKKLFSLVDGEQIGVHLGAAFMMTPRKSYACVLPIGPQESSVQHKCQVAESGLSSSKAASTDKK
jgi:hypothetical protein